MRGLLAADDLKHADVRDVGDVRDLPQRIPLAYGRAYSDAPSLLGLDASACRALDDCQSVSHLAALELRDTEASEDRRNATGDVERIVLMVGRDHQRDAGALIFGVVGPEWRELCEAIPPAYTEFIGTQLLQQISRSGDTQARETA